MKELFKPSLSTLHDFFRISKNSDTNLNKYPYVFHHFAGNPLLSTLQMSN